MIINCHCHLSLMDSHDTFEKARERLKGDIQSNNISKTIAIADNRANSGCADIPTLVRYLGGERNIYFIGSIYPFKSDQQTYNTISNLVKAGKVVGMKIFPGHDHIYPTDKRLKPVYNLCLSLNLPITIHTGINTDDNECSKYNDPKLIVNIAKLYPNLKIIIAHYFWPKIDYCFEQTINIQNIYYDTSGLADNEVLTASGGIEKIKKILTRTIEKKPNSVIFGTDYPMCRTEDHLNLINNLLVTSKQKQAVLFKNAQEIFKLK